jgi:hypothetical protein
MRIDEYCKDEIANFRKETGFWGLYQDWHQVTFLRQSAVTTQM